MTTPPPPGTPLWAGFVRSPAHGPLPVLLLVLTAATGVIDAVSILALGRVFVANMTGNVVFVGMALAGAPGFSLAASLAALAGFLLGALAGGRALRRRGGHRGRLLRDAVATEVLLVAAALVLIAVAPMGSVVGAVVAALLAIAMGLQNTAARKLAVPDLTTTVLTMTLTGIAADFGTSGAATIIRRVLAVLTMFGGALVGTILVLHAPLPWAMGLATLLLAVVALLALLRSRYTEEWHTHGL
jgi:uncharacterized membrane protein YoaK (UPF0700 family)